MKNKVWEARFLATNMVAAPIVVVSGIVQREWVTVGVWSVITVLAWWMVLRQTMNKFQGMGPIFWVTRNKDTPRRLVGRALVHETNEPWRIGHGLYVKLPGRWVTIGVCRRRPRPELRKTIELGEEMPVMDEVTVNDIEEWVP